MDVEANRTEGTDGDPPARELLPVSFVACGKIPQWAQGGMRFSELLLIANLLGLVYLQTLRLFAWATSATTQAEITLETVDEFATLLARLSYRFGTALAHFDLSVETAVAQDAAGAFMPRDPSTIQRHLNRLSKMRAYSLNQFDARVGPDCKFALTPEEISRIEGFDGAALLVLVERFGEVVDGRVILSHEILRASTTGVIAQDVANAAKAALDSLDRGNAFVVSRDNNNEELCLVRGCWAVGKP